MIDVCCTMPIATIGIILLGSALKYGGDRTISFVSSVIADALTNAGIVIKPGVFPYAKKEKEK